MRKVHFVTDKQTDINDNYQRDRRTDRMVRQTKRIDGQTESKDIRIERMDRQTDKKDSAEKSNFL